MEQASILLLVSKFGVPESGVELGIQQVEGREKVSTGTS